MKIIFALFISLFFLVGCGGGTPSSDSVQRASQEVLLKEGTSQTGMPAIKNFRERKLFKLIYELRDQEGLITYSYLVLPTGPKLLCESFGYAISDATGYTNPDKIVRDNGTAFGTMPQAEPNGLFTPNMSSSNWVICNTGGKPSPVLVTSPIIVSQVKL